MLPSTPTGGFPGATPLPGQNLLAPRQPQGMPDAQLARALGKAANPIVIVDRSSAVMWCNTAYNLLVKKEANEILRRKPLCLTPTRENAKFLNEIWEAVMSGQIWKGELLERQPDGTTINLDAVMTPLDDAHGNPAVFMLFLHDITERKSEYDKIWRQANYDRLTGLANRGFFLSMLEHTMSTSLRNQSRFALLYIDLDGFKSANDTYGHGIGDEVLIETGEILKNNVRRSDFVARLGGDEFACILTDMKGEEPASEIADQIISSLHLMKDLGGHKMKIGASIGIAYYPDNGTSQIDLIKNADTAMYSAKKAGKNCWKLVEES